MTKQIHNLDLEVVMPRPARYLYRVAAFVIDLTIFALYLSILVAISNIGLTELLLQLYPPLFEQPLVFDLLAFVLVILPLVLYFSLFEQSSWQGTIGKRLMKLRVENLNGSKVSLRQSLGRTALKFAPWQLAHTSVFQVMLGPEGNQPVFMGISILAQAIVLFYAVSVAVNKQHRSIYDRVSGTIVVKN